MQCQFCYKTRHITSLFYSLKNMLYGKKNNNSSCKNQASSFVASFGGGNGYGDNFWVLGSGATYHVTNDANSLSNPTSYTRSEGVLMGNGGKVLISLIGSIIISSTSSDVSHVMFYMCFL